MSYLNPLPKRLHFLSNSSDLTTDLREFFRDFGQFLVKKLNLSFSRFENGKSVFVTVLYRQRGRYARKFVHSGMAGLTAVGMMIAPIIAQEFPGRSIDPWDIPTATAVLSAATDNPATTTQVSDNKMRDKVIDYAVQSGDTVSSIAKKFDISEDTVRWQNNLSKTATIKPGQKLEIIPVTGVSHKVVKGDTIYSIAKKYDAEPQAILNFPFNTFVNDETFELAIGQIVIVPEGVKAEAKAAPRVRQLTPNAGTVVASGSFVWPANGTMSQYFSWYHQAIDIANRAAPDILAADAGTVVTSGWSSVGYGYNIVIDHGNGFRTLYAHMQRLYVTAGQTVNRGSAIGKMGSTGRSTGTHLHFEVYKGTARLNPLTVLR